MTDLAEARGTLTSGLDLQWRPVNEADPTERNFVVSSWLRSYARAEEFRHVALDVYFAIYQPLVQSMLARSTVAIAHTPELPGSILGWMAVEDDVLHYALVKHRFRGLGIASWMLREMRPMRIVYTHQPVRLATRRLVGESWIYDPRRRLAERRAA